MAVREFDRFAATYGEYNIIQKRAVEHLLNWVEERELGRILDLGCGAGEIYRRLVERKISFERFVGADLSREMLSYHPREERVELRELDFDDLRALRGLGSLAFDTVFSSSALQWSRDLDRTLGALSKLGRVAYFSFFTDGTFRSLLDLAGTPSPIHSVEVIREAVEKHYRVTRMERVDYRMTFNNVREMFRYIKRSGVGRGEARLSYRQTKRLMEKYPLDYLEFQLLFYRLERKGSVESSVCEPFG